MNQRVTVLIPVKDVEALKLQLRPFETVSDVIRDMVRAATSGGPPAAPPAIRGVGSTPVAPTAPRPAVAPDAPGLCGGCATGKHYTCDNRDARFQGTCSCAPCLAGIAKDRLEQEAWALVLANGALPPARTRRVPRPVYETGVCLECQAGCHSSCCLKADDYSPESGVIICSCDCVGWSLEQKRKEWLLPYDEVGVEAGICDPCSRGECTDCDWHRKRGLCVCERCKDSGVLAEVNRWVCPVAGEVRV